MRIMLNSNSKIVSQNLYLEHMSEPSLRDNGNGVYVGRSSIFKTAFILDLDKTVNRNIAILGMSGSGKSYFLKSMIIRSNLGRNSTVLIIDWNNEYKDVVKFLDGTVLTLGANMRINIFSIYELDNTRNVRAISELISHSLNLNAEESYLVYERILELSANKVLRKGMNIKRLMNSFLDESSALSDRLAKKLLQLKGNPMFADSTSIKVNSLLDGVVSIDFSMLKDDVQRDDTSKAIMRILVELMHSMSIDDMPGNSERMIVLDETWRLVRNSDEVGMLFREGRKYGFSIIVATQLASDISNAVLSNSASIFLFRLQNENDYRILVESGVITDSEKKSIMRLSVGSCMVSMALKEGKGTITKFFIGRTDGIQINEYILRSGIVRRIISQRLFTDSTKGLLANNDAKERIANFMRENNNEVDDSALVRFLADTGLERAEIVYYLRVLGLRDIEIVYALERASKLSLK